MCTPVKHQSHHASYVSVVKRSLKIMAVIMLSLFSLVQRITYERIYSFLKTNHPTVGTKTRKRRKWICWGDGEADSIPCMGDGYTCTLRMWKLLAPFLLRVLRILHKNTDFLWNFKSIIIIKSVWKTSN